MSCMRILVGVGSAIALTSSSALAGYSEPTLTLGLQFNDVSDMLYGNQLGGNPTEDGSSWTYQGSQGWEVDGGTMQVDWDMTAAPGATGDTTPRASLLSFVFNNLVVTNNTGVTQTVTMITTLGVFAPILPSSLMGGSGAGTLTTNGDGGTMGHSGGTAMYRAMIDGLFVGGVADLHVFDSTISVIGFGSDSTGSEDFGTPIPSAPGPAVLSDIGIQLKFTLTPGDSASWTSNFVVNVPGPAGASVLALAGVFAARRRR